MEIRDNKFTVMCPCCEATLMIDAQTGAVLAHQEKAKKFGSLEDLKKDLERQKQTRESIFAQELNAQKDRERLLEEKFQEAFKRADKEKDIPFQNPLDLD